MAVVLKNKTIKEKRIWRINSTPMSENISMRLEFKKKKIRYM